MLHSLTGLKFLAALSIVWAHLTVPIHFKVFGIGVSPSITSLLGMPLFFVLSGFVIHYNYARLFADERLPVAVRQFGVARFARLYPLFIAVLVFHLWHDDLFLHTWQKSPDTGFVAAMFALLSFSWLPIWIDGKLLIQQNFGIAWSISTEWFFYFSYIFCARYLAACSTAVTVKLIAAVTVIALSAQFLGSVNQGTIQGLFLNGPPPASDWLNSFYRWFFYISPYSRIFEFFLGCGIAQIVRTRPLEHWPEQRTITALIYLLTGAVFLTLLIYVVYFGVNPAWHDPSTAILVRFFGHLHLNFGIAPLFAALILLLAVRDLRGETQGKLLTSRFFILMGEASYSLYLCHPIALRIVPISPGIPNLWFRLLCGIVVTFALAIGTYTLIEVPARRWLRKKLSR